MANGHSRSINVLNYCGSVQISIPPHIEDTSFIMSMLQEAGYVAKIKTVEDWRDGNYKQVNISW